MRGSKRAGVHLWLFSSVVILLLAMGSVASGDVNEEWIDRYNGAINQDDGGVGLATDDAGNVYVAAYTVTSGTENANIRTFKFDAEGNSLWEQEYGGTGDDRPTSIALDDSANVFVAGYATGSNHNDYVLIKYDTNGNYKWDTIYNGTGGHQDVAFAMAFSGSAAYLTGKSCHNNPGLSNDCEDFDLATIKITDNGNSATLSWTNRYDYDNCYEGAYAIAVDSSGNVFVGGTIQDDVFLLGCANDDFDFVTIKYNPSTGARQWVKQEDRNGGLEMIVGLAVDNAGYVYVTGAAAAGNLSTNADYWTKKYRDDGSSAATIWTKTYAGPISNVDSSSGLVLDGSGNVYVTGLSCQHENGDGDCDNYDYATIKYNSGGTQQWAQRYNGPANGDDQALSIAIDDSNYLYVTGGSVASGQGVDYVTIQYNSSGTQQWLKRYNNSAANGDDTAAKVFLDDDGNVIVTGNSVGSGTGKDVATVKYCAGCLIGGQCYAQDETNPSDVCQICDVAQSQTAWSINEGATCDDSLWCTVNDQCNAAGACVGGTRDCSYMGDQCNWGECDEASDQCYASPKTNGTSCDDEEDCTHTDICTDGTCEGTPYSCDDSDDCTDDSCDGDGTCTYTYNTDPCDDGLFCTVNDECNGAGTCVGNTRDCSYMGDQCHWGECDEVGDQCYASPVPNHISCNDDLWCTVNDLCTDGTCGGTARDCDDGQFCTGVETCDEGNDQCVSPGDPCTDNGLFCDGTESCDEGGDTCVSSGDPCDPVTQTCNEDDDICEDIGCPSGYLCVTVYLHGFWNGSQHTCSTTVDIDLYSDPGQPADYSFTDVSLAADGVAQVDLATGGVATGSYYVVVRHFNHLDLITFLANAWDGATPVQVDFSVAANVDHGGSALKYDKSTWCMPGGDATGDNRVNLADYGRLLSNWNGTDPGADFNCDGFCRLSDYPILLGTWNMQSYAP